MHLLEAGARRGGDLDPDLGDVRLRQEVLTEDGHDRHRRDEETEGESEDALLAMERPVEGPTVDLGDPIEEARRTPDPRGDPALVVPADHLRRHQRHQRDRDQERAEERGADGQHQIAEELAGDAVHQEDRQEDHHRGERRSDERHRHLARAGDGRLGGGLALLDVLERRLEDDDAVVDQHPDGEREPRHRDQVQGHPHDLHRGEGDQDAHGHRDHRDQAGAEAAEEDQQHQPGQQERLQRDLAQVGDGANDGARLVEERDDVHVLRQPLLDRAEGVAHVGGDLHRVGVALLAHGHQDREVTIGGDDVGLLLEGVDDVGDVAHQDAARAAPGDDGVLDLLDGLEEPGGLQVQLLGPVVHRARRHDDVRGAQGVDDLRRGDVEGLHGPRLHADLHLALEAADHLRRRYAFDPAEVGLDLVARDGAQAMSVVGAVDRHEHHGRQARVEGEGQGLRRLVR